MGFGLWFQGHVMSSCTVVYDMGVELYSGYSISGGHCRQIRDPQSVETHQQLIIFTTFTRVFSFTYCGSFLLLWLLYP
jgi:hypothetical protein